MAYQASVKEFLRQQLSIGIVSCLSALEAFHCPGPRQVYLSLKSILVFLSFFMVIVKSRSQASGPIARLPAFVQFFSYQRKNVKKYPFENSPSFHPGPVASDAECQDRSTGRRSWNPSLQPRTGNLKLTGQLVLNTPFWKREGCGRVHFRLVAGKGLRLPPGVHYSIKSFLPSRSLSFSPGEHKPGP